jgi:hypothetical protein
VVQVVPVVQAVSVVREHSAKRFELFERFERLGVNPHSWTDFGESLECRAEKRKEWLDERGEEVFAGIQAAGDRGVARWRL